MSFCNPAFAKYPTEVLPEVQTDNVAVAGAEICSYSNIGRHLLEIRNLVTARPAAFPIETVINTDLNGEAQKLYSAAQVSVNMPELYGCTNKTRAREYVSIRQRSIGGAEPNIINRWNVVCRNYNILDLYRWGIKPDDAPLMINPMMQPDEQARILALANVQEREMAGELPGHRDLLSPAVWDEIFHGEIIEKERQIPALAAAGGNHILTGAAINVPPGMVAVILGVAVDSAQVVANLSAGAANPYNACFIFISRDDITNYVRMDAAGMPSLGVAGQLDEEMPMFIPALNKFQLQIVNNHTINGVAANLRVRIRYGLRKFTVQDHEKWGLVYPTNEQAAAAALIEKFQIRDKLYAGLTDL